MKEKFKYDMAISFAEEDFSIASGLATILEGNGFKVYYYKHENHVTVGQELNEILPEIYEHQAKYAIVIISKDYVVKRNTLVEFAAIKARREYDKNYLIPIKVGDVNVADLEGLTKDTVYHLWRGDYRELSKVVINKYFPSEPKISTGEDVKNQERKQESAKPTVNINFGGNQFTGDQHGGLHFGKGNISNNNEKDSSE